MDTPDILETIHQALKSQGVRDSDIHLYLDWIEDRMEEDRYVWQMRAWGMGGIGLALGLSLGLSGMYFARCV